MFERTCLVLKLKIETVEFFDVEPLGPTLVKYFNYLDSREMFMWCSLKGFGINNNSVISEDSFSWGNFLAWYKMKLGCQIILINFHNIFINAVGKFTNQN